MVTPFETARTLTRKRGASQAEGVEPARFLRGQNTHGYGRGMSPIRAVVLVPALASCLISNIRPEEHLRDAVHELNDDARWGLLAAALPHVHPSYRQAFTSRRTGWAREVQIADVEPVEIAVAEGRETATSRVALSWYGYRTMDLCRTVVRQTWRLEGGRFLLSAEDVTEGDASIFADADVDDRS